MKNTIKTLIIIIVILVAGIGVVGAYLLPSFVQVAPNQTFSKDGISFQYPGNWSSNVTVNWTGGNAQNNSIGSLGNGNVTLGIIYINITSPFDVATLGTMAVQSWKSEGLSSNVLSNTNSQIGTNTVDEIIYTSTDPISGVLYKYLYVIIGGQGKTVYVLRFGAPASDFNKYYNQFQSIVNTVAIVYQTTNNNTSISSNTNKNTTIPSNTNNNQVNNQNSIKSLPPSNTTSNKTANVDG